jgi:HK97 family phage prohead protease
VASSTTKDLHGDVMLPSALEDMEKAANNNLTIFLNHSYNVPEDVGGSVERAQLKTRGVDQFGNPNYDLDFDIVINESNPRATQTFEAIERGVKLGLSIGAMIPDGGASRDKGNKSVTIAHVDLLETSLVGIPANPRSWVEYAAKAFNSKSPDIEESIEVVEAEVETVEVADDVEPETIEDVEPEVTDATIEVSPDGAVSIDTTSTPQEAEDPLSQPEDGVTVGDSAEPTQEPEAPAALKDGAELVQLLSSIADATSELANAKVQIEAEKTARTAAENERDRVVGNTAAILKDVKEMLDRVADLPLSRKTRFVATQSEFNAKYAGVLDEGVLKMLLRK